MTRILTAVLVLLLVGAAAAQDPNAAPDPKIPDDTEIKTTASGLKYSILTAGKADGQHPKMGDSVEVHYTGWLTDGTVFDSSRKRGTPASFKLGAVIAGWNEGLQLMTPGARYKFTIPGDLAYGKRGAPPRIGPDATLIFDVELLSVKAGPKIPEFRAGDPKAQKKTESGLVYEVIREGKGDCPGKAQVFEIKYAFWNKDGKLIDCSELRESTIRGTVDQMGLPFLKEAPLLLKPGARYRFEVPSALGFTKGRTPPGVGENDITVWELELTRVIEVPAFAMSAKDKLTTTASGLQYEVIKEGTGKQPKASDTVTVHYTGWTTDGKMFDSSVMRGEPATFPLTGVIRGWTEGLQLMKEGGVCRFTIPGSLAYGPSGRPPSIGPNATLVFLVELIKVGS